MEASPIAADRQSLRLSMLMLRKAEAKGDEKETALFTKLMRDQLNQLSENGNK